MPSYLRFLFLSILLPQLHFLSFLFMASPPGIVPSAYEYSFLETTYGLTSLDGVEFPSPGSFILPPPRKVEIYQKTLDAGLRLPLTDFQKEVLHKDGCNIQMLTPNAVNKVVAFEMICRANGYLPNYFVFKYFFRFCCTSDKSRFPFVGKDIR